MFSIFFLFSLVILFIFYISLYKLPIKLFHKVPDGRGFHANPISQIGGILILISILIGFLLFYNNLNLKYVFLILIISPLFLLSALDDVKRISPILRLIFQILTIISIMYFFYKIQTLNIYFVVILIFFTAYLNFYNFMDGINGYVSSNFIFIYLTYGFLFFSYSNEIDYFYLIVICPVCVFFLYNYIYKKVFLGDSGSILLSILLIVFLIDLYYQNFLETFDIFFILLLYLIDGSINLLVKIYRSENIFLPHRNHFYQSMTLKFNTNITNFFQLINNSIVFLTILLIKHFDLFQLYYFLIFYYVLLFFKMLSTRIAIK